VLCLQYFYKQELNKNFAVINLVEIFLLLFYVIIYIGNWNVIVQVFVDSLARQDLVFVYGFFMNNISIQNENLKTVEKGQQYINLSALIISENNVEKWWPTGYGKQHLYTAFVSLDCMLLLLSVNFFSPI